MKLPEIIFSDKDNSKIFFARNIRNAKYNPVFEFENKVEYLNKKFNLNDLNKVWLYTNPYGIFQTHAILSFEFSDDRGFKSFINISYELRKTKPVDTSLLAVLFKNFESYYILGTNEDLINVRTKVRRNEDLYLFEIRTSREQLINIFLDLCRSINIYKKKAFFYRIMYRNCLTEILRPFKKEKVLFYTFFNLLNLNYFIYKNNLVVNENNTRSSYSDFLKKYKIKNNLV